MQAPTWPETLPEHIKASGFVMRPFRPGDGQALWEAIEEARLQLRTWYAFGDDSTPELAEQRVRRFVDAFEKRSRLQYAMIEDDGRLLGECVLANPDWRTPSFQLGYWIRPSAAGRGYVTQAASRLTRLAFEELGAKRVAIQMDAMNLRSVAIAERLGFALEGRLHNVSCNAPGELVNVLVFARTSLEGLIIPD